MTKKEQEEFARYQREAIRQMQEMQRRSRAAGRREEAPGKPHDQKSGGRDVQETTSEFPDKTEKSRPATRPPEGIKGDGDRMLLLGLILLFASDSSDRLLLLSLLYLLL